jgi:deazaflavin-dependent oxidoreductase (nitroreductase family)
MSADQVIDNPTGWVAEHIRRYVESGGEEGHEYFGYDALLLTTRGRKSGKLRRTALYYGEHDGRFLLVASNGGAQLHPAWYLNLVEHPEVEVQLRDERFHARVRTANASERPRLWEQMVAMFPNYAVYQEKAPREIPVVIVERV